MDKVKKESEHEIQAKIYNYFKLKNEFVFSVPNGFFTAGKNRFAIINKFKAEGYCPGVADLILLKNKTAYFMEIKRPKQKQNPKQIDFEKIVSKLGYIYVVLFSLEDAILFLERIKNGNNN